MVTAFTIARVAAAALLFAAGAPGCSAPQKTEPACADHTQVIFEPSLEAKGEHTIEITYDDVTLVCVFVIGEYVTPADINCDLGAQLITPLNPLHDSNTVGPYDHLPIVWGVGLYALVDEVTVRVDGTSYGPLATNHVEATKDACAHNAVTVRLE